jgi:hypothetical protein
LPGGLADIIIQQICNMVRASGKTGGISPKGRKYPHSATQNLKSAQDQMDQTVKFPSDFPEWFGVIVTVVALAFIGLVVWRVISA